MKIAIAGLIVLGSMASAGETPPANSNAAPKVAHGKYYCDLNYDNVQALTDKLNEICNKSKNFSVSTAIRSTGSIAMTFCCVAK